MSPANAGLLVAAALFAVGLFGVLARRNLLFVLISVEVMLNADGLAFVAAGAAHGSADGQVMLVLLLTIAATELAVALALVRRAWLEHGTLDTNALRSMRG